MRRADPAGRDHDRRPPTMADVARVAGVSHQTVSRVLSEHPHVRESTRAVVMEAMAELGYRRNASARALVTRRTRTLGVIACDTTLYGPASTLFSLEEAARAEGYFVSTVGLRRVSRDTLREALEHLSQGGVEGVVVIAPHRAAVAAVAELPRQFPVVTVEGGHDLEIPGVSVDQALGARLATEHLLAGGHETVWHVSGPLDWLEAEARRTGWRTVLEEAGAPVFEPLTGDWSPLSGYRAGQELAGRVAHRRSSANGSPAPGGNRRPPGGGSAPGGGAGAGGGAGGAANGAGGAGNGSAGGSGAVTAVFVANDQMALGVLRAFREAGVRVPEDVALVGFDDVPEAEFYAPPLTTVRQDFGAVGKRSIQLLLEQIEHDHEHGARGAGGPAAARGASPHVVIEPQLIVRASSTGRGRG
ncbi:LacI family DNA-binding transcriptional regulator [Phaeacidiphilus oryzae]|uniref:LacI family DNA-binding transcriptional regulator n=1 Tax=Phaeacidiphilus oryzae TaxID=348818 RepID=UPI00056214FA|nr:LacI family DNA-binding transcriptional regulator [Phaeacidiphilus oryzae]